MPGGAKGDIKLGLYVGLGVAIAFSVWALVQTLLMRAAQAAEGKRG